MRTNFFASGFWESLPVAPHVGHFSGESLPNGDSSERGLRDFTCKETHTHIMSHDPAITVVELGKAYRIWETPSARLQAGLNRGMALAFPSDSAPAQWLQKQACRLCRDFQALQGVTFNVGKGEALGIIGRNGSGKSTLLEVIAGTLRPSTGKVRTRGRVGALLELGSGFNVEFSGRENAILSGQILGLTPAEVTARLPEIEQFADIGSFFDQPVKTYSSGMQVRVAFAVQSALTPDILIVDEALSVGDERFQRKCHNFIDRFLEKGGTLLFTSHSTLQVLELCSRVLLLHDGQVAALGNPKDVVRIYHKSLYGGYATIEDIRREFEQTRTPVVGETGKSFAFFAGSEMPIVEPVRYGTRTAEISDFRIENAEGRIVNNLFFHERYVVRYEVTFADMAEEVRFGTLIRTMQGIDLAGMTTHARNSRMGLAPAGARFSVAFNFQCTLLPGSYTMNAGVTARGPDGEEIFLDRLVDVVLFKVHAQDEMRQNAFVAVFDGADYSLHGYDS